MKTMEQKEIQTESSEQIECMLCARIEELEKEKLELNEQLDIAQQERDEAARDLAMEQEHHQATRRSEEALAAHVERIITEWNSGDDLFSDEWISRMGDIVEDAPETNLARLKAQWQGEVLDEASNEFEVHERARMVLHWKAQKIRQQAEENTQ